MYKYHNNVWDGKSIFVFGSNLSGWHGAGAAKFAMENCGAVYGRGHGRYGKSLALPTKDRQVQTLPLPKIQEWVEDFIEYARDEFETPVFVTQIGCGLAGYTKEQIAPMFKGAPDNCVFPIEWKDILES